MKIAMTVWGNRVSPVFDSAQTILLAEIENEAVVWEEREFIAGQIPTRLARLLVDKGIDTLICRAISEQPAAIIESAGIKLVSFVSGNAANLLTACAQGTITDDFKMPGCRSTCCRKQWHQAHGSSTRKGKEPGLEKITTRPHRTGTNSYQARSQVKTKPLKLLLVNGYPNTLQAFSESLRTHRAVTFEAVASVERAWRVIDADGVDVLVVDETLGETSGLAFVRSAVSRYPMINCALVSSLAPADFHEASEGLGIFMQLPIDSGGEEAAQMINQLEALYAHLAIPADLRSRS